jgi:hypothetical protein
LQVLINDLVVTLSVREDSVVGGIFIVKFLQIERSGIHEPHFGRCLSLNRERYRVILKFTEVDIPEIFRAFRARL